MSLQVEHWDAQHDGELSEAALRRKLAARGYAVQKYVYPPGCYFAEHQHSVDKIDAVLTGKFRLSMYEKDVILEAGDCLFIPRGIMHAAEVVGDGDVVSLDAVKIA